LQTEPKVDGGSLPNKAGSIKRNLLLVINKDYFVDPLVFFEGIIQRQY